MRIDRIVSDELGVTRNRAQFIIDSHLVSYAGKLVTKHAFDVQDAHLCEIDRDDPRIRYVSRSAVKLATYLQSKKITVQDYICLDVGASTGGFTQVLLENGAKQVFSIELGTDQLDAQLREDIRVISLEKTDIRDFTHISKQLFEIITIDISFMPLEDILPAIKKLLSPTGSAIALFKPQFQVEKGQLNKSGVVKSEAYVQKSMRIFEEKLDNHGLMIRNNPIPASLRGEAGNQEWMYALCHLN